jgi:putative transcriptional regulator
MVDYKILLGEKIKLIRKQQHITQETLAELVDRSKNHISKIELGVANPPINLVLEIANALHIEPVELFDFNKYSSTIKNIDIKQEFNKIEDKKRLQVLFQIHKILNNEL